MVSGKKLGDILLDGDVLTKRQLNKALAMQETGDNRKLGEILVELGYLTIDDMTEVMMNNGPKSRWNENEVTEEKVMKKELSENTKFTLSVKTIISAGVGIATFVGFYYMMIGEIQEAKELPKIDIEAIYKDEYPSRPDGHNWPSSKEQYKQQVGQIGRDVDGLLDTMEELEEEIKDLKKIITELRVQVANKKDK